MRKLCLLVWECLAIVLVLLAAKPGVAATVGGTLTSNTTWSGSVIVLSNVVVPSGLTLTVQAGTAVVLTNGVSITAQAGGAPRVLGKANKQSPCFPLKWGKDLGGKPGKRQ